MKILIIEDDETIKVSLKYLLNKEGYEVILSSYEVNYDADLIILDLNLNGYNGFDIFKEIKSNKNIPVIFLTANDLEDTIVKCLEMGADDYITKPFKTKELLARIKKTLKLNNKQDIIKIKNIIIDVKNSSVFKDDKLVNLTPLEYKILYVLASNKNQVFTRSQILNNIWDINEDYVNDNTLTVYIKRIRNKLEDDINNPKIIKTVRGIGYKVEYE